MQDQSGSQIEPAAAWQIAAKASWSVRDGLQLGLGGPICQVLAVLLYIAGPQAKAWCNTMRWILEAGLDCHNLQPDGSI